MKVKKNKILVSSVLLKDLEKHLNDGYKNGYKPIQIILQNDIKFLVIFRKGK